MKQKGSLKRVYLITLAFVALLISIIFMVASFTIDNDTTLSSNNSSSGIIAEQSKSQDTGNITESEDTDISKDASQAFSESQDTLSGEQSQTPSADNEVQHGWVINNLGYTYIYGNSGYEQFNYKNTALERYVSSLNALAAILPNDTMLYNITVPVSGSFAEIPRDIYVQDNFFNSSQSAFVSTVSTKLDKRFTNVPIVSVLEEQYDNGEYVFFRTDKNWTALAAYTAYTEFCKQANLTPYPLDSFNAKEVGEYLGSFYTAISLEDGNQNYSYINALSKSPDNVLCYATASNIITKLTVYDNGTVYENYSLCDNDVGKRNAYNVFLGRVAQQYEIITNLNEGNLLIIGDSSVYPIVPFLASHYRKIDIINPSLYNKTIEEFIVGREYDHAITMCYSTNAVSGEYIPSLNVFTGVTTDE